MSSTQLPAKTHRGILNDRRQPTIQPNNQTSQSQAISSGNTSHLSRGSSTSKFHKFLFDNTASGTHKHVTHREYGDYQESRSQKQGVFGNFIDYISSKFNTDEHSSVWQMDEGADMEIDEKSLKASIEVSLNDSEVMNRTLTSMHKGNNSKRGNKLHCNCPKQADADIFCARANEWYNATLSRRGHGQTLQTQYAKLKQLYKQLQAAKLD